jgi:hypothetical protein
LLLMKFMDRDISSPRTAERKVSMWVLSFSSGREHNRMGKKTLGEFWCFGNSVFYESDQSSKERKVVGLKKKRHIRTSKLRVNSPFTCMTFGTAFVFTWLLWLTFCFCLNLLPVGILPENPYTPWRLNTKPPLSEPLRHHHLWSV